MTDEQTDKRLRRAYGITLAEYNKMLARQGGGCWICGSQPKTRRLAVDHSHKLKYWKVLWGQMADGSFRAWVNELDSVAVVESGPTRREAVRNLKALLKRLSVRGLLCPSCNAGLRKYRDNPQFLHNAGRYLEEFMARIGWKQAA